MITIAFIKYIVINFHLVEISNLKIELFGQFYFMFKAAEKMRRNNQTTWMEVETDSLNSKPTSVMPGISPVSNRLFVSVIRVTNYYQYPLL